MKIQLLLLTALAACMLPVGAENLDVMTLNVRYNNARDGENAWPNRKGLVANFLKQESPDIVGVQEALRSQVHDLLGSNPEFAMVGVGRDDGKKRGEYSAILYRKDRFSLMENGTFWLSDTPDKVGTMTWGNQIPRICTWARFQIKGSQRIFYLFNTHFDHRSQPSREKSAVLILQRIAARAHLEAPAILTGDFNAAENNPAMLSLKSKLTDTFRVMHPKATDVGTFHGFTTKVRPSKIDYVFMTPGLTAKKAEIHRPRPNKRFITDHEPVSATIGF